MGRLRRFSTLSLVCLLCVAVAALLAAATVGAQPVPPQTPIDSDPDDTDEDDGRIVPSEQVPFGIKTTYGDGDLERPSGGDGVAVAVVDTGVDRSHPDLENRVTLCRDFTGSTVRRDSCADADGHGTHVAGTVAADGGDDGLGIYGVAPDAGIYAFKACNDDGRCGADPLAGAVRAAADEGADVVVLSLGGRAEPRIQAALEYAIDNGVVVVAASGNNGPEVGSMLYPAAHPNVIAVGAAGPRRGGTVAPDNYRVPDFSARGVEGAFSDESDGSLEVGSVGVGVLSPVPDGDYGTKTGTSMAAPHAAGLAAKILAASPEPLSVPELRTELHNRAPRYDVVEGAGAREGYDPAAGFGIPTVSDPMAAFRVSPPVPVADEPFVLDGTASRSDAVVVDYRWDTTGDGTFDRTGGRIDVETSPGTHPVTLRVTDAENASATVTEGVFVNDRPQISVSVPDVRPGENATLEATVDNEFGNSTVSWALPDGTPATGDRVTYRFDSGESTVEATVTDEFGASSTASVTVVASPGEEESTVVPENQGPAVSPVVPVLLVVALSLIAVRRSGRSR